MTLRHPWRTITTLLLIGFLSILAAGSVFEIAGQNTTVEIEAPFRAARLSGQVISAGAGLPDVVVGLCEQRWRKCFAQSRTDANGNFEFPSVHT